MTTEDVLKHQIWFFLYPFYWVLNFLGILRHGIRQEFLLGKLAPGKTIPEFLAYLETQGFHNHFVAWIDSGQVKSVRRREDFAHQYHLRVFKDGEVRGHYELTPEAHPIAHFMEWGMEDRRAEFKTWLKDWVS